MSTSTLASLSGELGLIGLFDLGQLLLLNGATGRLVIHYSDLDSLEGVLEKLRGTVTE